MTDAAAQLDQLSPLQRAALTIRQLRGRLSAQEAAAAEPIAVVGLGCRFPGADTPAAFWELLEQGREAISEIPEDRWDVDALYHPDPAAAGGIYVRRGYFLREVDRFDREAFGLSPREANSLDPQHRLLLEVAWEALEDAGQAPDGLAGSRTGVFVGIGQNDYAQLRLFAGDATQIDTYDGTGNGFCFASGRLAHVLRLQGPNLAVDTACSSSLVAVHLACQSLRSRECDMALAGGVQLILSPEVTVFLCRARALSPDGRCKSFDASADGYGRGEGCGIVVLKRLSDALAAGDSIRAVIRGSAVNHNGPSGGLTVPSGPAQQALLRQALAAAHLDPAALDYVEAHGTGTALGDPIEAHSLASVLGASRPPGEELLIGSVKTNIGHLEAAAGIAGLIKVVLSLGHGTIPASLHLREPTPTVSWAGSGIAVARERTGWVPRGEVRAAGVSSFGISGTNAHVVLAAAPAPVAAAQDAPARPLHLLALSARTPEALRELAGRMRRHLGREPAPDIADACFTANAGRAQHGHRLALLAEDATGLGACLGKAEDGHPSEELFRGVAGEAPPLAWLFTGQGSQYVGMARELYRTQPRFRRILDDCDAMLRPELSPSLLEAWFAPEQDGLLHETRYTQPALFVLQHALAELWGSWGIEPAALLGHSVGEYAAACRAGVFGLEDGLRLIAARGRLMQALPRDGLMAAVAADPARVAAALPVGGGEATIAAVNGPRNTVLSGRRRAVEAVIAELARAGIPAQPLRTSHAFHSPAIDGMLAEFAEIAARIRMSPPHLPLISNLTGEPAGEEIATPDYWCRQARQPVAFAAGIAALARRGCGAFLEIGPAPVLLGMGRQVLPTAKASWLPSLRPGISDWRQMLRSLAARWAEGGAVDWAGFDRDYPRRRVPLPTTPFQRRRFWVAGAGPAREAAVSSDLLYRVVWETAPPLPEPAMGAPGGWVLLADGTGVASALARLLEQRGDHCLLLGPGAIEPAELHRRIGAFRADAGLSLRGALHFGALDARDPEEVCDGALALVEAMEGTEGARLWCVTRAAVPAGDPAQRLDLPQSALWGLGRSVALERPALWGGLVDLDAGPADEAARQLLAELLAPDGEAQVALRGGERRVPRLLPCEPLPEGPVPIRSDATYLVTGGLGALGLELARWLVRRGATHLVLTGRRAPSAEAAARLVELERQGATLRSVAVDAADRAGMAHLLAELAQGTPSLRGIFHVAGVGGQAPLEAVDAATLAAVLRPKASGALLLDELTRGLDLDLFVGFSSIAALWGGKGQAHYAAANQVLDALAHDRRARGLPALTVDWGPWSGGGIASAEARQTLGRVGITALPPRRSLAALGRLLASGLSHAAVVEADWSIFKPLHEGRGGGRFLKCITPTPAPAPRPDAAAPLLQRLREADPGRRQGLLAAELQAEIARILGYPEGKRPDPREGFFQLGMDSLMALELRGRLARGLGQEVPAALVFDAPTAEELARALLARMAPEVPAAAPLAAPPAIAPAAREPGAPAHEPIAIIGMACRFPGGVSDPERFWALLREGRDATGPVPAERWDADRHYDATGATPGTAYTRRGAFIDDVALFDAQFFGITPREAAEMDPQHRLLLELSQASLEDAGQARRTDADRTGVFVGLTNNEYGLLLRGDGRPERIGSYYVTGNALNAAAGRVSYALGLKGPSLTVDTACSSSLVAVHLACRSLWGGESDMAIAAGANLLLTPDGMIAACQARMLSPDGRCKTFDAGADGYGRGEGCGVVVLKRLSNLGPGDRIWALVRGTAVNQDGRSSGFTVPNGPSQQQVLRAALEHAGLGPEAVGYVEAHGTGTPLGDPIEIGALGTVYGAARPDESPLLVGSVKANIGHLESAAGIAGLIKAALVLRHGEVPRQPHLRRPNPEIAWESLRVRAAEEHLPWPVAGRRIAGVSAFGLSGTNAHVVLEEPPVLPADPAADRPLHLLAVSARTPEALRQLAGDLAAHLAAHPEQGLADVCFTAGRRGLHALRAAWVVASREEACRDLRALAAGEAAMPGPATPPRIGVFAGGGDAALMARALHATLPSVRRRLDELAARLGLDLPEALRDVEVGRPQNPMRAWLVEFALGLALGELLFACGIRPVAVTGQGAGELAAACLAGALGLEDGVRLCRERSRAVLPEQDSAAGRIGFLPGAQDAATTMAALQRRGCDLVVSIGSRPGPPEGGGLRLAAPEPGEATWRGLLELLAAVHRAGATVDLAELDPDLPRRLVSLPTYPFQRRRHWLPAAEPVCREVPAGAPLLRRLRSAVAHEEIEFEAILGAARPPFLADHRAFGAALLPSSMLLELVLAAGAALIGEGPVAIAGYAIAQPAVLDPERDRAVHAVLRPRAEGGYDFRLLGAVADADCWTCHATGLLRVGEAAPSGEALAGLRLRLSREESVEHFHDRLRRHGIELGGRFQALRRLWTGEGEALGEIRLPPGVEAGAFRAHPVLLDAAFQLLGAALGGVAEGATFLQAGIETLSLHAPLGPEVIGHLRLRGPVPASGNPPLADLRLFAPDGRPVATIEGLRVAAASRPAGEAALPERALYALDWEVLPPLDAAPMPTVRTLEAALAGRAQAIGAAPDLAGYGAAVAAIEGFCAEAAAQALQELGWPADDRRRYGLEEAVRRLGVAPRHRRLLHRLLAILAEAGCIEAGEGGWAMRRMPAPGPLAPALERLRRDHPEAGAELELLGRVAGRIAEVLRGGCDPQELLFPGGDAGLLARLYGESPLAAAMNALVAEAVGRVAEAWPEGRPLRVLEIGAGTGATTAALLPRLAPRCTEYVFTDASDRFTAPAAERFRSHPFLRCALLDIEQDPARQGFAAGGFDLVVAANVLHATRDLGRTLRHARRLLAPGGLLLLLEGTAPLRFLDLTFGLLEGWWRFEGDAARPDHPLLDAKRWRALLKAGGFEDVGGLDSEALGPAELPAQAVITARAAAAPTEAAGHWLILADRGGVGAGLGHLLRAQGATATLVGRRQDGGAADAAIAAEDPAEYRRLLRQALAVGPLRGVVHLWSLDAEFSGESGTEALGPAAACGCRSALHLAQAMLATPGATAPLHLVTRGAAPVGDGPTAAGLAQAPLWGLGKVLASEHSELPCRMIDLDPAAEPEAATLLAAIEAPEPDETRVALRAGRRHAPRLLRHAVPQADVRIRVDRTYLVTGAFGGIGLELARWLVGQGARHLVLLGRAGPPTAAQPMLREFAAAGVRVLAPSVDVARPQPLAAALVEADAILPPLAGVFHTAGVAADRLVVEQDWDLFEQVFAPKLAGAWNLHRLTRHLPLELFVLFSSASTLLGGAGLANYVAANEFLDALAHHRRRLGLPGLSIGWGPWAETGMARRVGASREAEWAALGLRPLPAAVALDALSDALRGDAAQLGVLAIDWARFRAHPASAALGGLLRRLGPPPAAAAPTPSAVRRGIEAAAPDDARRLLLRHVRAEVEAVLGWDLAEHIDVGQGFFDLGMDSLQANELRNRLQSSLGCVLPPTLVFKFPTVAALADHLAQAILGPTEAAQPAVAAETREARAVADEPAGAATLDERIRRELGELERLLGHA